MKKNTISVIYAFLLAALLSLLTLSTYKIFFEEKSQEQLLLSLWKKDIQLLKQSNYLPKEWNSISSLKVYPNTPKAKEWFKLIKPPIKTNSSGSSQLELLIISFESNNKQKAIIQYDLLDHKQNVIWELGRTFELGPVKKN